MTARRTLGIVLLTAALLLLLRTWWYDHNRMAAHAPIRDGILDLRGADLSAQRPISLDGQWAFYPASLPSEDGELSSGEAARVLLDVPGNWRPALDASRLAVLPPNFGFGTYRLLIMVDPHEGRDLGLRSTQTYMSSVMYVNGRRLGGSGSPAANASAYTPGIVPYSAYFEDDGSGVIDVRVGVANFFDTTAGGMRTALSFGSRESIERIALASAGLQLLVCVVAGLHLLNAGLLFLVGFRNRGLLLFAALNVCTLTMVLSQDDMLLGRIAPIGDPSLLKLALMMPALVFASLLAFAAHIQADSGRYRLIRISVVCCLGIAIYFWINPTMDGFDSALNLVLFLGGGAVLFYYLYRATRSGRPGAIYLLAGATGVFCNAVGASTQTQLDSTKTFYAFDLLFAFLMFGAYWFRHYAMLLKDMRAATDKLRQADKEKDDFLASTSHELKNPLHGMLGIAQSVLDGSRAKLDDRSQRKIELMLSVGRRMSMLLSDLMDLSAFKMSVIRIHPAPVDLHAVVTGVTDMLADMAIGKNLRMTNRISPDFPPVLADENRLIQILYNLLHNALKFTERGTIDVSAAIEAGYVRIAVADSGPGIPAEALNRIFEPYEQGAAGAAYAGGLGIGLSIGKQLAALHGGALTASSSPGKGTVFTLSLPHADFAASLRPPYEEALEETAAAADETGGGLAYRLERAEAETEVARQGKIRILAVDDDPVNLDVLEGLLSPEGYELATARSAKDALLRLEQGKWDLLISDVMMPNMSGYELTRIVRSRFPLAELPILLLTARNHPEDIASGFRAGANDYLAKPVEPTELRYRVKALTDLRQSVRERLRFEAAWLQAQIQPHFLFNTLNTIAALGEVDTDRMRALLFEFGNYLKASFDFRNSDLLVPLERELNLVRSYLYIKQERFPDRIRVQWDVDDSQSHAPVPPLSVQTLVENAVRHGILKRPLGGTVCIRAKRTDGGLEITITDDGAGIDASTLERLQDNRLDKESGIGLINTDRRLRQLFGTGLALESGPDGTTVSFIARDIRS
ncbi:Histidine kinase-like ATPase domain-containing protein [Cohnella sp. OV330]|uniref:hybrid sensor histidine kinase/response regulator n=1 Tax=Cohnella sp. OV330 TaxID=1855288 RepID=UPI0008F14F64|nr:ATP-binding protein [Cohnella sp. OV330]SFA88475.1 Histidine kinase-like ATPase domain-containing protein [Cohnella sp. OV330]